jgi:putative membrane protein
MKKTYLAIALATTTFFACNSGASNNSADSTTMNRSDSNTSTQGQMDTSSTSSNAGASAQPVSDTAKQFMMTAAAAGNTEVAASQVALTMAKSDRVKSFANMMVNDHTNANNELKSMATRMNVTLPDSVMPKQHTELETLRKTSAKSFDKQYMDMMVKDHKEAVGLFKKGSQNLDNNDLKTWASNTLPKLQMHLDSAQAIQKSVK